MEEATEEVTYGQRAVGLSFNPGKSSEVDGVKREFAYLIDRMHNLRTSTSNSEVARMCSVAITELQTAQMWAIKAITWR